LKNWKLWFFEDYTATNSYTARWKRQARALKIVAVPGVRPTKENPTHGAQAKRAIEVRNL
jgi:hypothetical protein